MRRLSRTFALVLAAPFLLLVLNGCETPREEAADGERAATRSGTPGAATSGEAAARPGEAQRVETILAAADAADGQVDHVVEKCAGCNLHMAGSADHSVHVLGYELHACSAHCAERFEKEPVDSVLAMSIDMEDGDG